MFRLVTLGAPVLAGLLALTSPASAEQVFLDFKTFGTVTTASLPIAHVVITADDGAAPTTVFMLNFNGLGVTGGAADSTTDGSEALHFEFTTLVSDAAVHVGLANNLDADGFVGEATIEAFLGATSLGVLATDDVGWKNVPQLFGVDAVTSFTVRADVDGNRIDAMRYTTYYEDLGDALAGTNGPPLLDGAGFFVPGLDVELEASALLENTTASLVVGFSAANAPFKGGILVPSPDLVFSGIPTGAAGAFELTSSWPAGVPSGFEIFLQVWLADGAGTLGFAASNGLQITTP